ncbi:unnamed protein product [Brachionus calyciflorus]|uniref:Uncharacterized protein n=1 Tax=Brachionus calyciflorus TaxID=104777 RepID=A0A814LX23_9BILA|nr:unnamed protein product [Brachionus calyciflorus]
MNLDDEIRERIDQIKDIIRYNDPNYVCLDLSSYDLGDQDREEIEKILEKNSCLRDVKWHQNQENTTRIEELVTRNLLNYEKFPSDFIHALLSLHVYENPNEIGNIIFESKDSLNVNPWNMALSEWKIVEIFNIDSYFGVLYINRQTRQAILANKAFSFDLKDLENRSEFLKKKNEEKFFREKYLQSLFSALSTANKVFHNWVIGKNFTLSFTGHGMAGWYASFQCSKLNYVKAVVFDSPNLKRSDENEANLLNITKYVTSPNFVNTSNPDNVTCVYAFFEDDLEDKLIDSKSRRLIKFKSHTLRKFILNGFMSFNRKGMLHFINMFNIETGEVKIEETLKKVEKWPYLKSEIYKNILDPLNNKKTKLNIIDIIFEHGLGGIFSVFKLTLFKDEDLLNTLPEVDSIDAYESNFLIDYGRGYFKTKSIDLRQDSIKLRSLCDRKLIDLSREQNVSDDFLSRFLHRLKQNYVITENAKQSEERILYLVDDFNNENNRNYLNLKSVGHLREIMSNVNELSLRQEYLNYTELFEKMYNSAPRKIKKISPLLKLKNEIENSLESNYLFIPLTIFLFFLLPIFFSAMAIVNLSQNGLLAINLIISSGVLAIYGVFLVLKRFTRFNQAFNFSILLTMWSLYGLFYGAQIIMQNGMPMVLFVILASMIGLMNSACLIKIPNVLNFRQSRCGGCEDQTV